MTEQERLIHNIRTWQRQLEDDKRALQATIDGLRKAMEELTKFMEGGDERATD